MPVAVLPQLRVVIVGVAQHLVDGALHAVHGVHHVVDGGVEELLGGLRVKARDEFRRVLKIGKEHRHLFALAFKGAAGVQDFLGQEPRGLPQQ